MIKPLILLVIFNCILSLLYGQGVFETNNQVYTLDKDEWYVDAVTLNDKELVLLGANITEGQKLQELVLQKINLAGVVSLERKLPLSSDSIYRFSNVFYRNGQLEVFGYAGKLRANINSPQYHNVLFRYVFDVALNLLYKETIPLPITLDYTIVQARFKINRDGNVYGGLQLFMEPSQVPLNPYGNFYLVLDNTNRIKQYSLDTVQLEINDLVGFEIHQISSTSYLSVIGPNVRDSRKSEHLFRKYDINFKSKDQGGLAIDLFNSPYSLTGPFASLIDLIDTNTFIMAGVGASFDDASPFYNTFFIAESKIDSSVEFFPNIKAIRTRKVLYFTQRILRNSMSNTQVPAYFQCLDRNTQGEYFFGGMLNHRMDERTMANDLVADTLCFAVINADLTLKLQTNFFNNEQITLHKVMYMPDGNMMAIGFTRDYIKNPANISRNYFALKLNKQGEPVTGLSREQGKEMGVSVYPNPALHSVQVSCPFEVKAFVLMNALGQTISEGRPSASNFSIDLSLYPSGAYLLQVFNQKGEFVVIKVLH